MPIISVINTKGGVGKTTTAIYLAHAYVKDGHPVVVIDLDQQGSASEWADRADDRDTPLPFRVEVSNAKRLPRTISQEGHRTIVILDTPPGDSNVLDATIALSDFVVVPTQASAIEIARVWETLQSLTATPHGVLITSARLGTKQLDDATAALQQAKTPVFDTRIPIRNEIRASYGHVPDNLHGYNRVAQDILEVIK